MWGGVKGEERRDGRVEGKGEGDGRVQGNDSEVREQRGKMGVNGKPGLRRWDRRKGKKRSE